MTIQEKATISFSDGTTSSEFPILKGSLGADVIDIRKLYAPVQVNLHMIQVFYRLHHVNLTSHILMVTMASCCTVVIQSSNLQ